MTIDTYRTPSRPDAYAISEGFPDAMIPGWFDVDADECDWEGYDWNDGLPQPYVVDPVAAHLDGRHDGLPRTNCRLCGDVS